MRLLKDKELERIYNHFYMNYSAHRYTAKSFIDIKEDEIITFILRYIKPPMQHFLVLRDDAKVICLTLKKDGIKKPIF